ncbi:MAG: hypothetical protein RLY31_1664 [Bacteroidota bacterium]
MDFEKRAEDSKILSGEVGLEVGNAMEMDIRWHGKERTGH